MECSSSFIGHEEGMLFLFTRKTRSSANMETTDVNSAGVIQSMALVIILLLSIWPVMEKSAADFILQLQSRHHFIFYSFFSLPLFLIFTS